MRLLIILKVYAKVILRNLLPKPKTLAAAEAKLKPCFKFTDKDLRRGVYVKTTRSRHHLMITNVFNNVKELPIRAVEVQTAFKPVRKRPWKNPFNPPKEVKVPDNKEKGTYKTVWGVSTDLYGTTNAIARKDIVYVLK